MGIFGGGNNKNNQKQHSAEPEVFDNENDYVDDSQPDYGYENHMNAPNNNNNNNEEDSLVSLSYNSDEESDTTMPRADGDFGGGVDLGLCSRAPCEHVHGAFGYQRRQVLLSSMSPLARCTFTTAKRRPT